MQETGIVYSSAGAAGSGSGIFLPLAGGTMTGPIVLSGNATAPLNPVTFQQFNLGLVGLTPKGSVEAASDANINLASPASALVDGHTMTNGGRFLAQAQTLPIENGIYIFNGVGVAATRDPLMATGSDAFGAYVSVVNGATYAGQFRICISDPAIVDTDDLVWDFQNSGAVTGDTVTIYESVPGILSIVPLSITNALVNAAAAIDGTKISPDFGSQNVLTTGTGSFVSVQITGSAGAGFVEFNRQNASPTAPADGFKLFSSNSDGLSFIPASGNSAEFRPNLLTGNHIYNLPNANGILALVPGAGFVTSNGTSLSNQATIDLSLDVSGLLDVSMGGTGSTAFSLGSVVFANASQLTEDNTKFFYDDTNNRLGVGNNANVPEFALQINASGGTSYLQRDALGAYISGSNLGLTKLVVENTFGSGVASEIAISSRPSGAMGAFEDLGWLSFFGRDNAGNQRRGAYIRGITSGAWTSTSLPTHMDFFTVPSGSSSEIQRARLHSSGELYIGNTGSVSNVGTISISPVLTTSVGLDIRAIGGQTADLLRIRNSGGTTIANIEADGDLNARSLKANGTIGAGFLELADQAVPVTAPTSAIRVFSNSGNFAVKTSSPIYTFDHSVLSTSRTFQFIDSDYIIANVPSIIGPVKSTGSDLTAGLIDLTTEVSGLLDMSLGGTGTASLAAGSIYSNGSILTSKEHQVLKTTVIQSLSSVTQTNITQLTSSTLGGGKTYKVKGVVVFQSTATGTGIGFRIAPVTATMSQVYGQFLVGTTGTAIFAYHQTTTATNTTSPSVSSANVDIVATFEGTFTLTVGGTVALQFRSETGTTVSVRPGSYMVIEEI